MFLYSLVFVFRSFYCYCHSGLSILVHFFVLRFFVLSCLIFLYILAQSLVFFLCIWLVRSSVFLFIFFLSPLFILPSVPCLDSHPAALYSLIVLTWFSCQPCPQCLRSLVSFIHCWILLLLLSCIPLLIFLVSKFPSCYTPSNVSRCPVAIRASINCQHI